MARTLKEEVLSGLPLTERELEVLDGAAMGEQAKVTADRLGLAFETVKFHRKNAVAKLSARTLTHATVLAVGMGYVDIEMVLEEHDGD